jgi:hypothetical protein
MNTVANQKQTSCCAVSSQPAAKNKQTMKTEESFSSSVQNLPSCSVLTKDCCSTGSEHVGKLHKNLILEQKEGNNVWDYYNQESLIG